jgi:methionyl-tRNA formyltransferase
MKVLFFGTPYFAEKILENLIANKVDVVGVVCQEDKPAGRGNKMVSPNIVNVAKSFSLPVYQFEKLSAHIEDFKNIDYDIAVTASYGKFLPKKLLDIKPCINVHPSLLPKYRGATPIQTALLNGDKFTGVSIMKTDVGMDDGDIYTQEKVDISEEDNYTTLSEKLIEVGSRLLLETLQKIASGSEKLTKQDEKNATFTKMIEKEDAILDFNNDVEILVNKTKAFCENPVCFFFLGEDRIKVFDAKIFNKTCDFEIGTIIKDKKHFLVQAKNGVFEILTCQAPGGKRLSSSNFLNGYRFKSMVVGK